MGECKANNRQCLLPKLLRGNDTSVGHIAGDGGVVARLQGVLDGYIQSCTACFKSSLTYHGLKRQIFSPGELRTTPI